MNNEKTVYEFGKNMNETVRAVIKNWNGVNLFDLRAYYQDKQTGCFKPGPKGLCLRVELIAELKNAISAVEDHLRRNKNEPA